MICLRKLSGAYQQEINRDAVAVGWKKVEESD